MKLAGGSALAAWLVLGACFVCPDGRLDVAGGELPLWPGERVSFRFIYDGAEVATPNDCDAIWFVDDIEWGNTEVGTVDACGVYTAPTVPPASGRVRLEAASHRPGSCHDCCPWASREIPLR